MVSSKLGEAGRFIRKNIVVILAIAAYMITAQLVTGTSCFIKSVTGFPCPGCGLTRATIALFTGDIAESMRCHPLVFLFYLSVITVFIKYVFFSGFRHTRLVTVLTIGLTAVFIAVYIIRMVLYFPDTAPMDYNYNSFIGKFISFFRQ